MNVIKKCNYCQKYKIHHKPYGHLPPKNVSHIQPWDEVHVDMIGPWKVVINNFEYQFRAVTCIDAIINLPEVIPVENTKSKTVAHAFEDGWLSRYPRPRKCVHDNGNEFLGPEFLEMLAKNNIQSVPTTVKNPQSNSVVERLHQTLKTTIAISLNENPPTSFEEVASLIHRKCAAAQFAVRATVHSQNKLSPGEMSFGRHMLYKLIKSFPQTKYNSTLVQYILIFIVFTKNNTYKIYVRNKPFHMKNTALTSKHNIVMIIKFMISFHTFLSLNVDVSQASSVHGLCGFHGIGKSKKGWCFR